MTHYLQVFQPRENDPLTVLVASYEDLQEKGSSIIKKSKAKMVSLADVQRILFDDGLLFQTLTPHEMNMHSLGERLQRFARRPFPAPPAELFTAVATELLQGQHPGTDDHSRLFYQQGGLSPAAFRVMRHAGDDVIVASERTHFVGDVMLLGTFIEMAGAFKRFGYTTDLNLDFVGELSLARRTIEAEAGVVSVFHENYRPIVWPIPYFDGQDWYQPGPVLLQPGDVVWHSRGQAMYLLNQFTIGNFQPDHNTASPNRTFIKTTEESCSATTLEGYGRNMHNILRCGRRALFFDALL